MLKFSVKVCSCEGLVLCSLTHSHTYTQTVPDWSTLLGGPGKQERDGWGRRCGGAEERTL